MLSKLFNWLNDLNPRGLLILAGFVFFFMFAVIYFFLSWWTAKNEAEENEEPVTPIVSMRTVVTAKTDIPPLTIIKAEMLQTKEVPEELVPSDAVADTAKIVNTSAKTAIFADDVITERKLLTDLKQLTFVGSIPPDCRAVSIGVSEVTGVDGFAKPGDKVDLLLVETDENRSATTNVLLQDVLLLSINKNMNKNPESAVAADGTVTTTAIDNPSIATFALRPDEVLKLISASKLGEIYLMLRPQNPTQEYLYNYGYTINSINSYKQQQPAPAPVATPAPVVQPTPTTPAEVSKDTNKIEIIEGDKIKDSGN